MEHWLTVKEVAALLGITERSVRRNATAGKYGEVVYEETSSGGGEGGRAMRINLLGLPTEIQVAYLRGYGQNVQEVVVDDADEWDSAPAWKRELAAERLEILAAWERYITSNPGRKKTEVTKEFIKTWTVINDKNKFSASTLYRWQKAYKEEGRCGLLPGWGKKSKVSTTSRDVHPEVLGLFMKMYGTKARRSVADCYQDLVIIAGEQGLPVPSLRTFQRIVDEDIPEATLIYLREGEEAWRNKCAPYILRDPDSIRAGQVWVGDHYRLDLFCQGPNGKPVRPWLTSWIDFRSWKLLGWRIGFSANTDSIMASFAEPAMDRNIGLPCDIYIDNGQDFSSYEFAGRGRRRQAPERVNEKQVRSLIDQLGIAPHFAIPANARAKTIERFHRIVSEKFCKRFDTYCGSDNKERPEGLDELLKDSGNVPTLEEVRELFDGWAVHIYNKLPSQGEGRKGESPDETFQRTRGPIRLAPESALRLCFMRHTQPLTVQRNGVRLFGQWYYTPELVSYLGERVYVRYRDADMTKVYVFSLDDEYLLEATLVSKAAALGASKEDIREALRKEKEAKRITERFAEIQAETELEPDTLAQVIMKKAADPNRPPDPKAPNVIEPVRIPEGLAAAAKQIELAQAAGSEVSRYEKVYTELLYGKQEVAASSEDGAKRALALLRAAQKKK